ncbi:MAG: porin [Pseudomonadota bacterium]
MKKILLCTTALVGFACSTMAAEDVKVSFCGSSKFEMGTKKQDSNHKAALSFSPNQKTTGFYTSQKAALKAEGKSDTLTYGAVLRLRVLGNGSDGMSDARNDRSHIYLDTDAGSVQLGSNFSASKLMQVDASTIASATGGVDGDWTNYGQSTFKTLGQYPTFTVNGQTVTGALATANFIKSFGVTGVDTLANRMDSNSESSRKVTYMSPRISGLQLGVSFAPDFNNNGGSNVLTSNNFNASGTKEYYSDLYFGLPVRIKNVWSFGLNYTNTFEDVNVALSVVADRGTAVRENFNGSVTIESQKLVAAAGNAKFNDLKTYTVGGMVGKDGFSLAGSYSNDGKSLTPQNSTVKSSWWTTGVAYENGPMSTSLTYLAGKKTYTADGKNPSIKSQILSLGADYEVVAGLKPFAEVSMAQFKPTAMNGDKDKVKATVFILGTKLKF